MSVESARRTSATFSSRTRATSSEILSRSGPMRCAGESLPPSAWYLPRNAPDASIDTMSAGSSTTQMTVPSRVASVHMSQGSRSIVVNAPQREQHRTESWAALSAATRGSARRAGSRTSASAAREAERRPNPGSFARHFSSSATGAIIFRRGRLRHPPASSSAFRLASRPSPS